MNKNRNCKRRKFSKIFENFIIKLTKKCKKSKKFFANARLTDALAGRSADIGCQFILKKSYLVRSTLLRPSASSALRVKLAG